jgi:hypothetical protein
MISEITILRCNIQDFSLDGRPDIGIFSLRVFNLVGYNVKVLFSMCHSELYYVRLAKSHIPSVHFLRESNRKNLLLVGDSFFVPSVR